MARSEIVNELIKRANVSYNDIANYYMADHDMERLTTPESRKSWLSQALAGKFGEEPARKWESLIEKYCMSLIRLKPEATSGMLTAGQKAGLAILQLGYDEKKIVLITGNSGAGKSYILKQFAQQHLESIIYLKAVECMTSHDVIHAIAAAGGLSFAVGTAAVMQARMIREMQYNKIKMVICDEADILLANGAHTNMLHKLSIFREIYEGEISVALVGLPMFVDRIRSAGETYILSRFGYKHNLPDMTCKEYLAYMDLMEFKIPDNWRDELVRLARGKGNFRYLKHVVESAKRLGSVEAAMEVLF